MQGSFYEQELQRTAQDTFRIEKVLERQGYKSRVKWMGYPKSFNCWIDKKSIVKRTSVKRFKTVEKRILLKTCFINHDKISFNIYW